MKSFSGLVHTSSSLKIQNLKFKISENPFKYSTYYQDIESTLYYCKARYYSPKLMRFISRDSYDLSNRYAYCDGNPVGNTDPDGHCSLSDFFNNTVVNCTIGGLGLILGVASYNFVLAGLSAANIANDFSPDYPHKVSVIAGINLYCIALSAVSAYKTARTLKYSKYSDFFASNNNRKIIFVDLDNTALFNSEKGAGTGVFAKEGRITKIIGGVDDRTPSVEGKAISLNNGLLNKLGDWKKRGYEIRILSTGSWQKGMIDKLEEQIKISSGSNEGGGGFFTSWTSFTAGPGGSGLSSSKMFKFYAKYNYMSRFEGEKLLLDDAWYHRWGARLSGGYTADAHRVEVMDKLLSL